MLYKFARLLAAEYYMFYKFLNMLCSQDYIFAYKYYLLANLQNISRKFANILGMDNYSSVRLLDLL